MNNQAQFKKISAFDGIIKFISILAPVFTILCTLIYATWRVHDNYSIVETNQLVLEEKYDNLNENLNNLSKRVDENAKYLGKRIDENSKEINNKLDLILMGERNVSVD